MKFEDAKLSILEMAIKINSDTFTPSDLVNFVLSFRHDLFQSPITQRQIENGTYAISCSCASTVDSCDECGPGHYTKFTDLNGQTVSFKIKKETT